MDAASQLTPACSTSSLSANLHLHGLVGTRAVRVSAAISWGICSGIAEKSFSDTSISLKGLHPAQPGRPRCKRQFRAADVLGVVCSAHLWALVAPGNSRGREGASVCQGLARGDRQAKPTPSAGMTPSCSRRFCTVLSVQGDHVSFAEE